MRARTNRARRGAGGGAQADGRGGVSARAARHPRRAPGMTRRPHARGVRRGCASAAAASRRRAERARRRDAGWRGEGPSAARRASRPAAPRSKSSSASRASAAFADVMLGHRLAAFAPPDRRLLTRLVLGTLAWRGTAGLRTGASMRRNRSKSSSSRCWRSCGWGFSSCAILTAMPQHAAVDTAVSLAREAAGARRRRLRQRRDAPRDARGGRDAGCGRRTRLSYLAVAYSHPRWLVECFIEWFGVAEPRR